MAANLPEVVAIRDSKDPNGPKLLLTPTGWDTFIHRIKAGDFDH
ncbi:DUF397 domain-containing protein [Streptosporangium amethystogenes]